MKFIKYNFSLNIVGSALREYRLLEQDKHERAREEREREEREKLRAEQERSSESDWKTIAIVVSLVTLFASVMILPYILASLFGLIGLLSSAILISISLANFRSRKRISSIEIHANTLAGECLSSLIELEMDVDAVVATRGIGTNLEEALDAEPLAIKNLQRKIAGAIAVLKSASDPASQLEAVGRAEVVKARVLEELG